MSKIYDVKIKGNRRSCLGGYFDFSNLKKPIEYLKNFNDINIFVGANNSGKSRFMRGLMSHNNLEGRLKWSQYERIVENHDNLVEEINFSFEIDYFFDYEVITGDDNRRLLQKLSKKHKNNAGDSFFNLNKIVVNKELNNYDDFNKVINNNLDFIEWINIINPILKEEANRAIFNQIRFIENQKILKIDIPFLEEKEYLLNKLNIKSYELREIKKKRKSLKGYKIYIPTLRTAHSLFKEKENESKNFKKVRDDIFLDTARKNYEELNIISHEQRKSLEDIRLQKENTNAKRGNIDVFTGMNLYNEIVNVRNSKKEKREQFHEFEKFLSTYFFEGKTVDIVADFNVYRKDADIENDDSILVLIGETTRKLHELGDGVQALIILMYKIFLADNDSIIYIDEPEINLHPGYQRLFLEQITTNPELTKKNLTYVIVTHSNHFLDLTLEKDNVSIYSFSALPKQENEEDKFMIRNVNAGDNQMLRDLGVNNSSVFLANSSIWLEGISDRNFIKAFLIAYCEVSEDKVLPREDIDFAFFEYAGSNLTHYDFEEKNEDEEVKHLINSYALNNRIFLVSDLDEGQETKHNTLEEIAEETENFSYKTTYPYREIENLLPNEIWKKVLIEFWNKTKIKDEEVKGKAQEKINASLAKEKSETYSKKYIGEFLNALSLGDLNQIWEKDTKGNHKTFKQKAKLSEVVLKKVRNKEITWEDFAKNGTIKELTEAIYNFIKDKK